MVMRPECGRCGGLLYEDFLTGITICDRCGWGFMQSGRWICPACLSQECYRSESFFSEEQECDHECFLQGYYGSPYDIGFITPDDY